MADGHRGPPYTIVYARESRADSGVSCNGPNGPQGPKPKPKVHNDAGSMPEVVKCRIYGATSTSPEKYTGSGVSLDDSGQHSSALLSTKSVSSPPNLPTDDDILLRSYAGEGTDNVTTHGAIGLSSDDTQHESTSASPQNDEACGTEGPIANIEQATKELCLSTNIFTEAWAELRNLQLGVQALRDEDDSSDDSPSELSASIGDVPRDTRSDGPESHDVGSSGHLETTEALEVSVVKGANVNGAPRRETPNSQLPSDQRSGKRQRLDSTNDDHPCSKLKLDETQQRDYSKRLVCCFENGPGRQCSGTDDSISEVIKNLSERHNTHVCDRCWTLLKIDPCSGLKHHGEGVACHDHCLSPQCHNTTPTIGHRHEFDQQTCRRKTSRVRPGDTEAVYRYIFHLVQPALQAPPHVLTDRHALHLDAIPRIRRRRANPAELSKQAEDLGKRLQDLEIQSCAQTERNNSLEAELAEARRDVKTEREKIASLEAHMRRIVSILGDALRTGSFQDESWHLSLLGRVEEDAPNALICKLQTLATPTTVSGSSHRSSSVSTTGHGHVCQNIYGQGHASLKASCDKGFDDHARIRSISDPGQSQLEMDDTWLAFLNDPADVNLIASHGPNAHFPTSTDA